MKSSRSHGRRGERGRVNEALAFDDLAVAGGLADGLSTRYRYRIEPPLEGTGKGGEWQETSERAVPLGFGSASAGSAAKSGAGSAAGRVADAP